MISQTVERYGLEVPFDTPEIALELLCYRTNRGPDKGGLGAEEHFKKAFRLMWPKYQWSDWVERIIHCWCNYKWIIIIGHQRASKSYTTAYCAMLDYMADPQNTLTSFATVTLDGLRLRMWSDLMKSVEEAQGMPLQDLMEIRNTKNELRVYPKDAARESGEKYQIHGMASNNSGDAEGKIRGGHAPRRRIVLDEAQNIADPVFRAMINPMSAPDAKAALLTNPVEKVSEFGSWCEPKDGWGSITANDLSWPLNKFTDGICLHLNGLHSPNVKAKKNKYHGLLTVENVEEVRRIHGEESVQWHSLILGMFPPDGMVSRVFPASVIEKAKPPIIFDFRPEWCASLDPAFEFDACPLHFGQLGKPIFGVNRYAINCTETILPKLSVSAGSEPKDYQIAHFVMRECHARGVRPEHFIMDGTGGGRGVVAILQKEWSQDIQVVEYGGAATDRPLRGDSSKPCNELYDRFVGELWFRTSEYVRDGIIGGLSNLDPETEKDLYARLYELKQTSKGMLQSVETKKVMKERMGKSPDYGDAFVQFGELLARLGTFVGAGKQAFTVSSKWASARMKAKRVNAVYADAKEFTYH